MEKREYDLVTLVNSLCSLRSPDLATLFILIYIHYIQTLTHTLSYRNSTKYLSFSGTLTFDSCMLINHTVVAKFVGTIIV